MKLPKESRDEKARKIARDDDKYAAHTDEQTGDYRVRTSRAQDIAARILCALAAVVLWLYVMSIDSPDWEKTFTGVLVNIENEAQLANDYGMSVISGYDNTVSVTVKGKKSDIDQYTSADISAFVDLIGVTAADRHSLEVKADAPAGMTVLDISPNTISVYTDQLETKIVPVDVNLHYTMESTIGLGIPETNIDVVTVSGPAGVLESIEFARAELDLGQVTTSMTQRVPLKLVDENGDEVTNRYVKSNVTDVLVQVPVYMYKDIPVVVNFKYGYLNAENARVVVTPSVITVRGDPLVLAAVHEYRALEIDETRITGDFSQRLKVTLPDNLVNVDSIENLTVEVTHIGTATSTLATPSSRIQVKLPEDKSYEFLDSVFSFTIRGPEDQIANFRATHMQISVDLTAYADVVGIVTVPVTIKPASSAYADRVYAIGSYQIQVRLS
ncbi:MAG: hypothetical protein IKD37_00125 [Clostridia bacterium]|nr:hypothetical protein [Clostridia bacterium]